MPIEITDKVPLQEVPKKKPSTRARKQTKKKTAINPAASLITALKFVAHAQKKAGPVNVQFSHITNKWAAAFDGILTIAHPIEEDLNACPNTLQFIDALSKATDELSITQLSANCLAVSSGVFRALVPCVNFDEVPIMAPDPQCAVIDNRIKEAFASVAGLALEGAQDAAYGAILLQAETAVATNGAALLEYWHGIDLPPNIMLPKVAANAVAKASENLVGFGFSQSSATFYFENGSFIKTQLYPERFPNYATFFENIELNLWPVPEDFFKAVRAIESFSEQGSIYFENSAISSNLIKESASTYKIEGLPEKMGFNAKNLLSVEHAFKSAHFVVESNCVFFFGPNMRGLLMGLDLKQAVAYDNGNAEDVPF